MAIAIADKNKVQGLGYSLIEDFPEDQAA